MREFFQWRAQDAPECPSGQAKPWLLLGKGPTFSQHRFQNLDDYHTIAINHVIREVRTDIASVVDIGVIADCGEAIDANARFLLMPGWPYDTQGIQSRALEAYFDALPILRKLSGEGRLLWYNLGGEHCAAGARVVPPGAFSAETLVSLLALSGARTIRTLGVDGGRHYDGVFADIAAQTCLQNGQESFDVQFEGIARTVRRYGLDYAALALPARVQEHTLQRAYVRGRVRNLFPAWLRENTRVWRHHLKRQFRTHLAAPLHLRPMAKLRANRRMAR